MLKKFAAFILAVFVSASAAPAQDQATPGGFSVVGSAAIQALFGSMKINLGCDVTVLSRAQQFRVDISRLAMLGTDPTMSALAQQFLPQGSFTVLVDRANGTTTLWSNDKRKYYVLANTGAGAPAAAVAAPGSVAQGLQFGRMLSSFSVYDLQISLAGRRNVDGRAATVMHYSLRQQKRGGELTTTAGDVSFDDQQGLPLQVTGTLRGRRLNGSIRVDFQNVSMSAPDASQFAVPAGFIKANDPSEIFGNLGSAIPH